VTGPARVDDLLDAGAVGLRFFVEFLPRAHRVGAASAVTVSYLADRYYAQRGLDIGCLASDADALGALSAVVGSGADEQRSWLAAVPTTWEGGASCAASGPLAGHVEWSRRLHDTIRVLADTVAGAATAIGLIVDEKSRAAEIFADPVIGGLGPDEVDAVLAGASGAAGPSVEQLARWSTGLAGDANPASVAEWCVRWLNEVFVPGVETAVGVFTGLCDDAERAIGEVFDELARAFDALDEHRFRGIGTDVPSRGGRAPETRGAVVPEWGSPGPPSVGAAPSVDVVRAGVALVESGLELAAAVGELSGAVLELGTAVAEGATAVVDGAADAAPAPDSGTIPPVTESPIECEPGPASPTGPAPTTVAPHTGPSTSPPDAAADNPHPDAAADNPHPDAAADNPRPDAAADDAPEPTVVPGSGVPGPPPERGRGSRTGPDRTGAVPTTEGGSMESAEPTPDGGVILPEAGPL
jgi:hypothetical protein